MNNVLNRNLALPFASLESIGKVYAFMDLEHPAVRWAVMRGMLVSASHAAETEGFVSFMQAGIITAGNNPRLFNETIIELYRQKRNPHCRSRMRGMYFFGTIEEATARIGDNSWPDYFTASNLVEFELLCDTMPTIVDANWITFARTNSDGRIPLDDLSWISKYWDGTPYNNNPVWEVIADGVALVLHEQLRRSCNSSLENEFPNSHIPILMARLAAEVGSRGGQLSPFLLRENETEIVLTYLSHDAEFHDSEVIQRIGKHPDFGKLGKMMSENETWNIPDLRPWCGHFRLGEQRVAGLGDVHIASLHDNKLAAAAEAQT